MNDKLLAALSYVTWVPSLYIVLTDRRRQDYVGWHGCQALKLWSWIFVIFFGYRWLLNLLWTIFYIPYSEYTEFLLGLGLWIYAAYCGYRAYQKTDFQIP